LPTATPSTFTCTLAIADATTTPLSIAHPLTVAVPDTTDPAIGDSIITSGGILLTVTVTDDDPVSGLLSLSVAETVIV
jgi:hypothetical protein